MPAALRLAAVTDAPAVTAIYNQGIAERGATFETRARTVDEVARWFDNGDRFPTVVFVEDGRVLGWANLRAYRPRECYAGIAEFSIYVHADRRGRGVGRALLGRLIEEARSRGYWKLLSRIFSFNTASLALCRAAGFREVGVYEKHGRLDGQWLDVVIVERVIPENLALSNTSQE
jgi:phosphinothricin acetyltransferase